MSKTPIRIPITRPVLDDREVQAAARPILKGWVMQGNEVEAFEADFAKRVGALHACAVSSGTAALHLALLALRIGPGDQVITASYTFIATANAVRYCGADPVLVDIEPESPNLDPEAVEQAITAKTRAIIAIHQIGMPCDLTQLLDIAKRHNLRVLEDAACAIGSEVKLGDSFQPIGRPHGDIAIFSFHPRKVITTGDGGMITTNDPELDASVRSLRQHGMTIQPQGPAYERLGYNYRLTDIQAAIGREQLERLPKIILERRRLAERYTQKLTGLSGISPPLEPGWARSNWQSYQAMMDSSVHRDNVIRFMLGHGIAAMPGLGCVHHEALYADEFSSLSLPHSEYAMKHGLLLPLYPGLRDTEQNDVLATLTEAMRVARS